ncbi:hypothetical protein MAPG_04296 [Magnaporthiopsis poae ATCC 64411]|uniref:Berberine/berberine-like domain-containing protein n=1 Tax=Magnaporthiopsis poae (strain ATCC 64411 / 73-15) TaxID=644358 RepID=A0A0C4DWC0_MAGP6|nr:hypothetical protein MAPG_04296 [Magnaporthiopsis poae ATCC 64411]
MFSQSALSAIVAFMSTMAVSVSAAGRCSNKNPCAALAAAGLRDPVLMPGDAAYTERINTLWSASARLAPACIVTPRNAAEVSTVLQLNPAFVADMLKAVPADQLGTQSLFQPLPKLFSELGREKGGNVMGMDRVEGDSLLWLVACTVQTAEQEKVLQERLLRLKNDLVDYARSIGALRDWQYINYANPTQSPVETYGPENVAFLKQVSAKYDPNGFFQKQQGGGVKLPA